MNEQTKFSNDFRATRFGALIADESGASLAENAVTLALLTAGTAGAITSMMGSISAYIAELGEIFGALG